MENSLFHKSNYQVINSIYNDVTNQPGAKIAAPKDSATGNGVAYLFCTEGSSPALLEVISNKKLVKKLTTDGFWEIIIQTYTETHSDTYSIHNVTADTYATYATGVSPINVTLEGKIASVVGSNHSLDLLSLFTDVFRGTAAQRTGIPVYLLIRNTTVLLHLMSLRTSKSSMEQDCTTVSLQGVAGQYDIINAPIEMPEYSMIPDPDSNNGAYIQVEDLERRRTREKDNNKNHAVAERYRKIAHNKKFHNATHSEEPVYSEEWQADYSMFSTPPSGTTIVEHTTEIRPYSAHDAEVDKIERAEEEKEVLEAWES